MLVGYKLTSRSSLSQSKLSSNVAIHEKNEHIRNEGFLLCSADSLPYYWPCNASNSRITV